MKTPSQDAVAEMFNQSQASEISPDLFPEGIPRHLGNWQHEWPLQYQIVLEK
jgi:hypothetical protein